MPARRKAPTRISPMFSARSMVCISNSPGENVIEEGRCAASAERPTVSDFVGWVILCRPLTAGQSYSDFRIGVETRHHRGHRGKEVFLCVPRVLRGGEFLKDETVLVGVRGGR